jgi:hypothetical protein
VRTPALLTLVLAVVAGLGGCAVVTSKEPTTESPVKVEKGDAPTDLGRLTLSPRAAERLGIETVAVAAAGDTQGEMTVPYAAVLYDPQGNAWAYANPSELVFVRTAIEIASIEGDRALLTSGPDVGTKVVTVGVAELYGAETGVGGEH